ncbi:hypothetical protein GF373_12250 [bacterium]|nr:hypothetical protein [bacterium]
MPMHVFIGSPKSGHRLFIAFIAISLCLATFMQPCQAVEEARIPAGEVLERAGQAWETIRDYQAIVHQTILHPSGKKEETWAKITLVKANTKQEDSIPTFLAKFYDKKICMASKEIAVEPKIVYYADDSGKLYTYKASANSLTIEYLENAGPLPEFLHIAGFLSLDVETLKEKAYLDDEVYEENIDGISTYRIKIVPRKKMEGLEPPRFLWFDRETNLPKRLAIDGDITVTVNFVDYQTNQDIDSKTLVPEVPENTLVSDKTR